MFRRFACLALLAPLALSACGKKSDEEHEGLSDSAGATHVAVALSDKGCNPNALTVKAGKVAFDVSNKNSASVTEFYVLKKNDDIVGEVENVIPGAKKTLTLQLDAGSYLTKCPNGDPEKGTLTVSAS